MSLTTPPRPSDALLARGVTLRSRTADDEGFFRELYVATRRQEFSAAGWPEASLIAFLGQQFLMQTRHYDAHYPGAAWAVVELDGEPAGRLLLQLSEGDLRVIDVVLSPPHRGQGLGTALMRTTQSHALELGASTVSLHVEQGSRALPLYRRLGFEEVETRGLHTFMIWRTPHDVEPDR